MAHWAGAGSGTTIESVVANMRDQSILQLRMDNTTTGADMGGGTAGLLGFSQKMTQSDENFSVVVDVASVAVGNGGSGGTGVDSTGGNNATEWTVVSGQLQPFLTSDERSDKKGTRCRNASTNFGDSKLCYIHSWQASPPPPPSNMFIV